MKFICGVNLFLAGVQLVFFVATKSALSFGLCVAMTCAGVYELTKMEVRK